MTNARTPVLSRFREHVPGYSPRLCMHTQRQQPPELLRVPLEGVVLTVKATFGDAAGADATLCRALTPPAQAAVAAAVANLKVRRLRSQRLGTASAPLRSSAA
jgi:hypothetical protein